MKLIIFFISFTFLSCKSSYFLNGVRNPKVESSDDIRQFLESVQCDNFNNVSLTYNHLKVILHYGISPTCVYIFNKKGELLKIPSASNKCSLEPSLFIRSLNSSKEYVIDPSFQLDSFIECVDDKNYLGRMTNQFPDFFVFITWAKWCGKKNFKKDVMTCIHAVTSNTNAKFELALLNMDVQKDWGQENLKKLRFTRKSIEVNY